MKNNTSRRDFLKGTTLASVGFWFAAGLTPKVSASPNERIAFAGIGAGGTGGANVDEAARFADIVAVCDVDKLSLNAATQRYPKAKPYTDYRKLFDEMEKSIDAATVGTADHMHAPIGLMAMRLKKHVYIQKPLARTIYECRLMAKVARETGVCTQMGNQGSSEDGLRRHAAEMKAGLHGDIKEIHVWTDRPLKWWPQGPDTIRTMKAYEEKVRKGNPDEAEKLIAEMRVKTENAFDRVDWDLWLGVSKPREFFPGVDLSIYHPHGWRGWWDFGAGALGDMACHLLNVYMKALDLSAPSSVVARTSGHDFDVFPLSSEIVFEYPDTPTRKGFKFVWYDGGWYPSREFLNEHQLNFPAPMPIGGEIVIKSDNNRREDITVPEVQYAPKYPNEDGSIGEPQHAGLRHMFELITAIKENKPELCFSNFPNQAGPLTEAMLLGNLAVWTASKPNEWGEKVLWDSANMKITNLANLKTSGVADLIKPVYREGYVLD